MLLIVRMKYHQNPTAVFNREFFVSKLVLLVLISIALFFSNFLFGINKAKASQAASVSGDFRYSFNSPGTLLETGSMGESSSPYFWVNSGAKLVIGKEGSGGTVSGKLPISDPFRVLYSSNNALDTESGYHPQNIFRLLTRSIWGDLEQELTFRITNQNLADSPNREGHNGILLMSRYSDQYNLYYAGIRNDGEAIIKKKVNGSYYTLASVQIFGVKGQYDRTTTPSLLPKMKWMRMKVQVTDQKDGSVKIRLLLDRENDGSFVSILSAVDQGVGGEPLHKAGYAGIRTDFMDVEFDNYRVSNY